MTCGSVTVITAPEALVSLEEAKAHLRVETDEDNSLIEALIAAASAYVDGPFGCLGRSIGTQGLRLTLSGFPAHAVRLPLGPVASVQSVNFVDPAGDAAVVDASVYVLAQYDHLQRNSGAAWPAARSATDLVTIDYQAGFGTVPAPIKAAALLVVGDLYNNREAQVIATGAVGSVSNPTVGHLLAPYRILFV